MRHVPLAATVWALMPYLAAQILVLAFVLAVPGVVHLLDPPRGTAAEQAPTSATEIEKRLRDLGPAPGLMLPPFPNLPPVK